MLGWLKGKYKIMNDFECWKGYARNKIAIIDSISKKENIEIRPVLSQFLDLSDGDNVWNSPSIDYEINKKRKLDFFNGKVSTGKKKIYKVDARVVNSIKKFQDNKKFIRKSSYKSSKQNSNKESSEHQNSVGKESDCEEVNNFAPKNKRYAVSQSSKSIFKQNLANIKSKLQLNKSQKVKDYNVCVHKSIKSEALNLDIKKESIGKISHAESECIIDDFNKENLSEKEIVKQFISFNAVSKFMNLKKQIEQTKDNEIPSNKLLEWINKTYDEI